MALETEFNEVNEHPFYSPAYHRSLKNKKLVGSKCTSCGHVCLPPKPVCPKCEHTDMETVEMEGMGKLAAYTVITVAPPLMVDEGFDRNHPYCSGVVALKEGPKITARILGVDATRPETIQIGTPVKATYVEAQHGDEVINFLAFEAGG